MPRRSQSPPRGRDREDKERPDGVPELSMDDYFLRSQEFRIWLKEDRNKYFDELSGEQSRKYFKKFVKEWNRGRLPHSIYEPPNPSSASRLTGYKWNFADSDKLSIPERSKLEEARTSVAADTYRVASMTTPGASSSSISRTTRGPIGPSMPPPSSSSSFHTSKGTFASDARFGHEERIEAQAREQKHARKRARDEDRERTDDLLGGPREVGREGALEKKRAKREGEREYRAARDDAGLEVSEDVLMGSSNDSFKARIAQRDAARARTEAKRQAARDDRGQTTNDRLQAMRDKERQTMEMFANMAREKYGA